VAVDILIGRVMSHGPTQREPDIHIKPIVHPTPEPGDTDRIRQIAHLILRIGEKDGQRLRGRAATYQRRRVVTAPWYG
jgi:hypothetical protein